MSERIDQSPAFAIADWLYSYRVLAAILLTASILGSVFLATRPAVTTPAYSVQVRLFPSGTPLRGVNELADILIRRLEAAGYKVSSPNLSNPVMINSRSAQSEREIEGIADEISQQLRSEIRASADRLRHLSEINEGAVQPYIQHEAFLEATDSQLIALFDVSSEEVAGTAVLPRPLIIVPFFLGGLLFVLFAGTHSFWQSWSRHRRDISIG